MNMSTALNNALGGLSAASRGAAVVSGNIANALTPGYARRSLELATSPVSGNGVRVVGITRHQDPVLIANRRATDADLAAAKTLAQFHSGFEKLVGTANDATSISARLAQFESRLITAASLPGSAQRLDQVLHAGSELSTALNNASEGVRQMRSDADRTIGKQVDTLNQTLKDIEKLNARIPAIRNSGGDIGALLDQRQILIDQVNELVPVNAIARDNDQVSLYSDGGLILLEGTAAAFSFTTTGDTMPHMTVDNGLLSGLELNGHTVRVSGDFAQIRSGALMAQFANRDELAVEAQADLDAVARDLIERFETAGLDPTTAATDPGLFTDDGNRFDPAAQTGLASRIALNAVVDPDTGGESWKLRAGLGALTPGAPGDASQLQAFSAVLTASRPTPAIRFGTGSMRAAEIAEALSSKAGANAHAADQRSSFAANAQLEMQKIVAEHGVDSDTELQRLMQIEQAYAANARIVAVVDELMDTLLRL
ncbi:flagellar hook-associated protein 1 FlgK [Ruegeria halocynthiae]|uniref:Flagellar hook-associated protein 1 n=1 Tax=Ruegeria halocynthiae TaxID=985054 RepID=A0A1H3DRP7_9RHOB|nr:flagellar hook-associated protein FlgK [Ruegeria halocynthiae]SDX69066.1 flagellar hook-associated protein 1 FlgK [Ruegeria halocynthiae]